MLWYIVQYSTCSGLASSRLQAALQYTGGVRRQQRREEEEKRRTATDKKDGTRRRSRTKRGTQPNATYKYQSVQ